LKLTLYGRIPSKKNSRWTKIIRGIPIQLPSKKFVEWHREQSEALLAFKLPKKPLENVKVTITFYAPDLRKTDLTNKAESIMDVLVDNKFLKDDNWYVVPEITLKFAGKDKENPRAEIEIN